MPGNSRRCLFLGSSERADRNALGIVALNGPKPDFEFATHTWQPTPSEMTSPFRYRSHAKPSPICRVCVLLALYIPV